MTTTAERAISWWDCSPHREQLRHATISEAVEAWADDRHPEPLPETVKVYGWAKMELPSEASIADDVLDFLIERIDEEYGNPEETTEPGDALKAAALQFAREFRAHYRTYMCEQITEQTVRIADHVPASWLNPPATAQPAHSPSSVVEGD